MSNSVARKAKQKQLHGELTSVSLKVASKDMKLVGNVRLSKTDVASHPQSKETGILDTLLNENAREY